MKIASIEQIRSFVKDGMTVMVGGFMTNGTPRILMDAIAEAGVRDLTVVCNDAGYPDRGVGRLITAGCVKKMIISHMGLNPELGKLFNAGVVEVELVPQGTLAERVRAGGAGLGGVLTPTGLGTSVADGKQTIVIDGKEFLIEKPLKADVSLLRGSIVDKFGNTFYKGTTRNFNTVMAMAADTVIIAAEKIVEIGEMEPESVMTPGIFIDYIVGGEAYAR